MPYFIRRDRPDLIERFNDPARRVLDALRASWTACGARCRTFFEGDEPIAEVERSIEYGALIIHSLETGSRAVVYGNVPNAG